MNRPGTELSEELVQRIQAGDGAAWEELYLRYRDPLLLSIRCRMGGSLRNRVQSEDVLQSVFSDVLGDVESFSYRGKDSLLHWMHQAVINKLRNKARFYGAHRRAGERALSDSALEHLAQPADTEPRYLDERYDALERALTALPDELREVVILRRVEGLSNQAVASTIGKTPAAASKVYNRALARLAVALGPDVERSWQP